jgi:hypothetical protein
MTSKTGGWGGWDGGKDGRIKTLENIKLLISAVNPSFLLMSAAPSTGGNRWHQQQSVKNGPQKYFQ